MQVQRQSVVPIPLLRTHGARPIIDLQDLRESTQHARALEAYDRLSSRDALDITSTHRRGHLFAEFRARYGSAFHRWPLENRPDVWRMMVAKPTLEPATTVAGVMGADHHRLHDPGESSYAASRFAVLTTSPVALASPHPDCTPYRDRGRLCYFRFLRFRPK